MKINHGLIKTKNVGCMLKNLSFYLLPFTPGCINRKWGQRAKIERNNTVILPLREKTVRTKHNRKRWNDKNRKQKNKTHLSPHRKIAKSQTNKSCYSEVVLGTCVLKKLYFCLLCLERKILKDKMAKSILECTEDFQAKSQEIIKGQMKILPPMCHERVRRPS